MHFLHFGRKCSTRAVGFRRGGGVQERKWGSGEEVGFRRGGVQERWGSGEEVGFRRRGGVQERREAQERREVQERRDSGEVGFRRGGVQERWGSGEEAQICTSQSTSCLNYKSVVREKDLIFSKEVAHAAVIHLPPFCAAVSGLITATVV